MVFIAGNYYYYYYFIEQFNHHVTQKPTFHMNEANMRRTRINGTIGLEIDETGLMLSSILAIVENRIRQFKAI